MRFSAGGLAGVLEYAFHCASVPTWLSRISSGISGLGGYEKLAKPGVTLLQQTIAGDVSVTATNVWKCDCGWWHGPRKNWHNG